MEPIFLRTVPRADGYTDYIWSIAPGRDVTLTGPWAPGTLDTPTPDTLGIIEALTRRDKHAADPDL